MTDDELTIVHLNDVASVASTLADAQRRRGDRAFLVELPKPGAGRSRVLKLLAIPLRIALGMVVAMAVRRRQPDVVHVHYATQAFVAPLTGRPYVVHCHGTDIRGVSPASRRGRLIRAVLRRAVLVLYSTPDLRAQAESFAPSAEYLPNPIDTERFALSRADPVVDVLVATRLDAAKGGDVAIESVVRLLELRPETTVTIVEWGNFLASARRRLDHAVRFVPPVGHDEMPALLGRHRVVLGQFHIPALGQLELEAMAVGRHVVTRGSAGQGETPRLLVSALTPGEVVAAIRDLLDRVPDPGEALDGRTWVERHHGMDRVAQLLDERYAVALGRERKTAR